MVTEPTLSSYAESGRAFGLSSLYSSLGERIRAALEDRAVCEIMLNPDGRLFVEYACGEIRDEGRVGEHEAESVVRSLATILNRGLDLSSPILSGELPPSCSRFEGLLPPLAERACFSIRKHRALNLTLDDLLGCGVLTVPQAAVLREAIVARRSLIIMGQTGTGKTTMLNALLNELALLCPHERLVSIEDTRELQLGCANHLCLRCSAHADHSVLIRSALRMRPDRIILGEVRGREALDLIDAFATGHEGSMATLHAGSIEQGLSRLCLLVSRHEAAPRHIEQTVAGALDLLVLIRRHPRRHVAAVARVLGYHNGTFNYEYIGDQHE